MNNLPYNRICFSFSRGFGNAVVRNRARRLSREAFRLLKPRLNGGHDLILIINKEECCKQIQCSSVPAGTAEIIRKMTLSGRVWQLKTLFTKAGLFK
jgi:ribonuclease P protein component